MNKASISNLLAGLSPEARDMLGPVVGQTIPTPPACDDHRSWQHLQAAIEMRCSASCEQAVAEFAVEVTEQSYAGMPALRIRPPETASDNPVLFLHGGGYTGYSARASLRASAPLAAQFGRPLIALDYPLAPMSKCPRTVSVTAAAIAELMAAYPRAPLIGDSAGGGLALAATSKLLRQGQPGPAALALISPWTDLGDRGDSRQTLCEHDPLLSWRPHLAACAAAYAPGDEDNVEASPVLADYAPDFPPTLIMCGTREILLSDAVRLHQRMASAGAHARLHLFEGLYHSFPTVTPRTPEANQAREVILAFLRDVERPAANEQPAGESQ